MGTDEEPHMHNPQHLELAKRNFQGARRGRTGGYHRGCMLDGAKGGIKGCGAKASEEAMIQRKGWLTSVCLHSQLLVISSTHQSSIYINIFTHACFFLIMFCTSSFSTFSLFLSWSSRHKGCHVEEGEGEREVEMFCPNVCLQG